MPNKIIRGLKLLHKLPSIAFKKTEGLLSRAVQWAKTSSFRLKHAMKKRIINLGKPKNINQRHLETESNNVRNRINLDSLTLGNLKKGFRRVDIDMYFKKDGSISLSKSKELIHKLQGHMLKKLHTVVSREEWSSTAKDSFKEIQMGVEALVSFAQKTDEAAKPAHSNIKNTLLHALFDKIVELNKYDIDEFESEAVETTYNETKTFIQSELRNSEFKNLFELKNVFKELGYSELVSHIDKQIGEDIKYDVTDSVLIKYLADKLVIKLDAALFPRESSVPHSEKGVEAMQKVKDAYAALFEFAEKLDKPEGDNYYADVARDVLFKAAERFDGFVSNIEERNEEVQLYHEIVQLAGPQVEAEPPPLLPGNRIDVNEHLSGEFYLLNQHFPDSNISDLVDNKPIMSLRELHELMGSLINETRKLAPFLNSEVEEKGDPLKYLPEFGLRNDGS